MKRESEQQRDFMDLCGLKRWSLTEIVKHDMLTSPVVLHNVALAKRLIMEEVTHELMTALTQLSVGRHMNYTDKLALLAEIVDGIVDGKYVLDQLGNCLGFPLNAVFDEIQRTNMAKAQLQDDGTYKIIRRADGKILKPEGWTPPNILAILENELDKQ